MIKRLKDLLSIESYSGKEQKVIDYLIRELPLLGFTTEVDEKGNVYAIRGEKDWVLLNAHMDSVEGYSKTTYYNYKRPAAVEPISRWLYARDPSGVVKSHQITVANSNPHSCLRCAEWNVCYNYSNAEQMSILEVMDFKDILTQTSMFGCFEKIGEVKEVKKKQDIPEEVDNFKLFYNEETTKLTSNGTRPMGGDDKCGIAIALKLAENMPTQAFKLLFTVEEEIGCVGIKYAIANHLDFFDGCLYSITCDRRGGNDICITTGGEYNASNYFIAEIAKWGIVSGVPVSLAAGSSSDNFYIKRVIPNAINLAAGYYSPHTNQEYVMVNETIRTYKWVKNFIGKTDFVKVETARQRRAEKASN